MILSLVLLFALIIVNGFFAGSEIAFISLNQTRLEIRADQGEKKANMVLRLKEKPNRFLSTIQIGVSLASILSGAFASEAFATSLSNWIVSLFSFPLGLVKTFSMIFITLITSYLMLVFGELVPKRIAMANPRKFAYFAVGPLSKLASLTTPIVKLLSSSTNISLKLMGIDPEGIKESITEEEIRRMVDDGQIKSIEKEMIENIFQFDDLEVWEIMTKREKIIAIDAQTSLDGILELISRERFTRYPVYEGSLDNIIGIIHLRELLRYIKTGIKEDFNIRDLLAEAYFVPESQQADEVFRDLQQNQLHMAIALSKDGLTAGIITMENLIEVIMGEILDEYDEALEEKSKNKILAKRKRKKKN